MRFSPPQLFSDSPRARLLVLPRRKDSRIASGRGLLRAASNPIALAAAACKLTFQGHAYTASQRLPFESDDAHLTGLKRSLERRMLGLNVVRPVSAVADQKALPAKFA